MASGRSQDRSKNETVAALKSELLRLQKEKNADQAAARALKSLEQKINSLQMEIGKLFVFVLAMY